jgi:hypothetical protein
MTDYLSGLAAVNVSFAVPVTPDMELTTEDQIKEWATDLIYTAMSRIGSGKEPNVNDKDACRYFEAVNYDYFEPDAEPDEEAVGSER